MKTNEKNIIVSVVTITYNHEKYIKDTIEGVLMQKTDFDVEFIISNDASIDKTDEVIQQMINRNSNMKIKIKYHNHTKNKGSMANFVWTLKQAQGKYIAICEGDDYWTDPYKLQKQVDFLERDSKATVVFHPCYLEKNGTLNNELAFQNNNRIVTANDVISYYGQFAPTSSYFFRKSILNDIPKWINNAPIGDFFLEMYSLKNGYGIYLNEGMSVYRINTENSWSLNVLGNETQRIHFNLQMIKYTKLLQVDFPNISQRIFNHIISLKLLNLCHLYFYKGDYNNYKQSFKDYINLSDIKNVNYLKLKLLSINKHIFKFIWKTRKVLKKIKHKLINNKLSINK